MNSLGINEQRYVSYKLLFYIYAKGRGIKRASAFFAVEIIIISISRDYMIFYYDHTEK